MDTKTAPEALEIARVLVYSARALLYTSKAWRLENVGASETDVAREIGIAAAYLRRARREASGVALLFWRIASHELRLTHRCELARRNR